MTFRFLEGPCFFLHFRNVIIIISFSPKYYKRTQFALTLIYASLYPLNCSLINIHDLHIIVILVLCLFLNKASSDPLCSDVWFALSHTYQFLSACFRNLTNATNSTYYQAFTMRNVWESVVSEAWRGSPFILAGHTMQPDMFLNRILIAYFFFSGG